MDRRFAIALVCSLALHIMLLSALRVGGGNAAPWGSPKKPFLVYLRTDAASPLKTPDAKPDRQGAGAPAASSSDRAFLPGIQTEDHYFLSSEVDTRAQPIRMPVLVYPEGAQQMRIRGHIRMRVYINESGKIDAVDIIESDPPGIFEKAALRAMLATKYIPARRNGRAVKNQKLIEIKFDPYETISQPQQETVSPGNF